MRAVSFLGKLATVAVVFAAGSFPVSAATVSPEEAAHHLGQKATVCGVVASAHYAARSRAQPTFLNLGKPYPDEIFTAVIFGSNRAKFGTPETTLRGKRICVTGTIRRYRGEPEIILKNPSQITK